MPITQWEGFGRLIRETIDPEPIYSIGVRTAQDVKDQKLMLYRMELLFLQYRRHLVTDLLNQASKGGSLITGSISGEKEKYSDLLDHLNNEILKTVKLITDDEVNIPEKTDQDVAPEVPVDEEMSEDEVQQWSELLDYAEKMDESNSDENQFNPTLLFLQ